MLRYVIPPNDTTALHDHPAHVNVVLTDGHLELAGQDGKKDTFEGIHLDLKGAPAAK